MRFLHISDLHIGKVIFKRSMVAEQRYALQQVLDMAVEREVDALVLAGDLYDNKSPSSEAMALLDWFLTAAAAQGTPVLGIPGNHDAADKVGYASRLLTNQNIHLARPFDGQVQRVEMADEHGPVTFWLLPFLAPPLVRRFFEEAELGDDYTQALQLVLDECQLDPGQRNVLVAHQFVVTGGRLPQLSDSESIVGATGAVDASIFDGFDYVALGHIHRPQRIGRDEVRYSGSLLKYSISEIPYDKSAVLVELGPKGQVDIELVPIVPQHDMRQIRGPLEQLISPEVVAQQPNAEDYLHVVLTDSVPQQNAGAQLLHVYPNLLDVVYDNTMSRAGSVTMRDNISEDDLANPLQLFEDFYAQVTGEVLTQGQHQVVCQALDHAFGQGTSQQGGGQL